MYPDTSPIEYTIFAIQFQYALAATILCAIIVWAGSTVRTAYTEHQLVKFWVRAVCILAALLGLLHISFESSNYNHLLGKKGSPGFQTEYTKIREAHPPLIPFEKDFFVFSLTIMYMSSMIAATYFVLFRFFPNREAEQREFDYLRIVTPRDREYLERIMNRLESLGAQLHEQFENIGRLRRVNRDGMAGGYGR